MNLHFSIINTLISCHAFSHMLPYFISMGLGLGLHYVAVYIVLQNALEDFLLFLLFVCLCFFFKGKKRHFFWFQHYHVRTPLTLDYINSHSMTFYRCERIKIMIFFFHLHTSLTKPYTFRSFSPGLFSSSVNSL